MGEVIDFGDDEPLRFDGATYEPDLDEHRLSKQYRAVHALMLDHQWWTLAQLSRQASARLGKHVSEASASARIRDQRKARFGGHWVERERLDGGLFRYRLLSDEEAAVRRLQANLDAEVVSD